MLNKQNGLLKSDFLPYVSIRSYCLTWIFKIFSIVININRLVEKCSEGKESNG